MMLGRETRRARDLVGSTVRPRRFRAVVTKGSDFSGLIAGRSLSGPRWDWLSRREGPRRVRGSKPARENDLF